MTKIIWSIMKHRLLLIFLIWPLVQCSHRDKRAYLPAQLDYFFTELHPKGYEKMEELIHPLLVEASQENKKVGLREMGEGSPEVKQAIRQALIIVLSKPGHDASVSRLVRRIQSRTQVYVDFWGTLSNITRSACAGLKNEERSPMERATYFYMLENIIAQLRPMVKENDEAKNILSYIAQAKIKVPKKVHSKRYMEVLEENILSPSKLASKILRSP